MKTHTIYETDDGERYDTEAEAKAHEADVKNLETVNRFLREVYAPTSDELEEDGKPKTGWMRKRAERRNTLLAFLRWQSGALEPRDE